MMMMTTVLMGLVEAVSFVPLSFPQYYCTRHFKRLPKHAPSAWDDCMWLLSLQEGESAAAAAAAQDASDNSPGTLFTAFRQFENEIILLKPFLMYCCVFASSISTTNICYKGGMQRVHQGCGCSEWFVLPLLEGWNGGGGWEV
jgi:hypothetical protein